MSADGPKAYTGTAPAGSGSKTILLFGFPADQQIEPGQHTILHLPAGLNSVLSDDFAQSHADLIVFYPHPNLFGLPRSKEDALALLSHLALIRTPGEQAESSPDVMLQENLRAILDLAVERLLSVVFNSGRASEQGPKYTFLILPAAVEGLDDVTREIWEGLFDVDCSHQGPLDFLDLTKYSTREIGVAEQIPEIRAVISRHMSKLGNVMCPIPSYAGWLFEPGEPWDMLNDHLNHIADRLQQSASLEGRTISPAPATFRLQGYPLFYDRGDSMAAALAQQANVFVFFLPYIVDPAALVRDLIQTLYAPPAPAVQLVHTLSPIPKPPRYSKANRTPRCPTCGWNHNSDFTVMVPTKGKTINLTGCLPDIVKCVHRKLEAGQNSVSSSDPDLASVSGCSGSLSKAFGDRNKKAEYKQLFDRSRRGFISLRDP